MAALVGACDSPVKIVPAAAVDAGIAGATFEGTVGSALSTSPTFIVKDAGGNALAGKAVTVAVTSGGGTLTAAATTSVGGATSVGVWKLGNLAGTNTLTVTTPGVTPLAITATAKPDVPAAITVVSGDAQSVPAGTVVPASINFKVADKFGNGVPNIGVAFSIAAGGGSFGSTTTLPTDANGVVLAPLWTLGKSNVPQQIAASTGALAVLASASVVTNFVIDLRQFGPPTGSTIQSAVATAFTAAANRLSAEITGGVSPQTYTNLDAAASLCSVFGQSTAPITISAVLVYFSIDSIDGPSKILGSAGPCLIRGTRGLTTLGTMRFDSADIQGLVNTNRLNDVILHEMHHVLGFGTLWTNVLPSLRIRSGTALTAFVGPSAIAACTSMGGGAGTCLDTIPLENTGGGGTADSHWRETTFKSELMTGFISGATRPLSAMTIASMQDLGYTVNMNVADISTIATLLRSVSDPFGVQANEALSQFSELLLFPRGVIDSAGKVTPLPPRP